MECMEITNEYRFVPLPPPMFGCCYMDGPLMRIDLNRMHVSMLKSELEVDLTLLDQLLKESERKFIILELINDKLIPIN